MKKRDVIYISIILLLLVVVWSLSRGRRAARWIPTGSVTEDQSGWREVPLKHSTSNDLSRIAGYVKRPGFPIRLETNLGEYQLLYSYLDGTNQVQSHMPLKYCPWTGQALPKSKRGNLFVEPNPDELQQIGELFKGIRTLSDAKRILGTPDDTTQPFGDVEVQWTYNNLFESTRLVIQKKRDGTIAFASIPKQKK